MELGANDATTFKYDVSTIGGEAFVVIFGTALLLLAPYVSVDKPTVVVYVGFGIAILGAWVHGWAFWKSPWRIVLTNSELTAFWRRRRRSWSLASLRKRDPQSWFDSLLGAKEIVDLDGRLQFRIWKQMIGSKQLLDAIRDY